MLWAVVNCSVICLEPGSIVLYMQIWRFLMSTTAYHCIPHIYECKKFNPTIFATTDSFSFLTGQRRENLWEAPIT